MTIKTNRVFRIRVRGEYACFTRPEFKVERVSYEAMTPSAAQGVLEAILWKPAIRWNIHSIEVLAPIRWMSLVRNEVGRVAARPGEYFADEDRQQRSTVALRDVDYVVSASMEMTSRAAKGDNSAKFDSMFKRRLEKGQHFQQPYLGCREFAADVRECSDTPLPIEPGIRRPLGMMFWGFDYASEGTTPLFFEASLVEGILEIPSREAVLAANAPDPAGGQDA